MDKKVIVRVKRITDGVVFLETRVQHDNGESISNFSLKEGEQNDITVEA